jgi:hypothetical protein
MPGDARVGSFSRIGSDLVPRRLGIQLPILAPPVGVDGATLNLWALRDY